MPPRPGPKRARRGDCPACTRAVVLGLAPNRVELVVGPHLNPAGDACAGVGQLPKELPPCSA